MSVSKKIQHDSVFKEVTIMQAEVKEIAKKSRFREEQKKLVKPKAD